jgi:acetate kinase
MTEDTCALMQGTYDIHTKFTRSFQSRGYVNRSREEMLKAELAEKKSLAEVVARPR